MSIVVGVVWGIYAASWVVGISAWIITECALLALLLRHALHAERPEAIDNEPKS
jgi:hypothetical protein